MIDIEKAKNRFQKFIQKYDDQKELGFTLKVTHTYHVIENAKTIATKLNLSKEDIKLAEIIALLHDIGRFEEITVLKQFDNGKFDHASYGTKMLFEDNLIREFLVDNSYDTIIKTAIKNHSKLEIENNLDKRCLLHTKIIRDADKLDNFRVKLEENIAAIFPGKIKTIEDIKNSTISPKVYETIKNKQCVNIKDRVTALDYWCCILGFIFDLNFKETYQIVKSNNYINLLIDKFNYQNSTTKNQMNEIKTLLNNYINHKINE